MKRKKSTPPFYSIIPFCPFSPLSFILIRSLLLFISLPYHLFFHSRKGIKALHRFVSRVLHLPSEIRRLCTWYEMREREEKKPMTDDSEVISSYIKRREKHIRLGPWGSTDGTDWDDGFHQSIERIFVSYSSSYICSIQIVYKDFSNNIFIAPQHGSSAYSYIFEAVHPPPETPITRIDGYFDKNGITYLELSTINGMICSFGIKTGSPFMYKDPRGFTGFHGRSDGVCLCALGVYVNSSATKS